MTAHEVKQLNEVTWQKDAGVEGCENLRAAYRKRVDVVVVLSVKQSHGAPGAPPLKVSLISQKLQHMNKNKQTLW